MANLILYGELTRKADLYRWGAHQDTKEIELKGWRAEQLSYGYNYMDSIYPEGGGDGESRAGSGKRVAAKQHQAQAR